MRAGHPQTLDEIVVTAISTLFPDATAPDEDNYIAGDVQYKAPDHELMAGRMLIERKTLNATDGSQFYKKLAEIADKQGKPFRGYGIMNLANIISKLPDPRAAERVLVDFMLNRLKKNVGVARKKFDAHFENTRKAACARLVVILDQSTIPTSTDWIEFFIGNLFVKQRSGDFDAGLIDGIVYVKNPEYVLTGTNSYWFKCLIKNEAEDRAIKSISSFAEALHSHMQQKHFFSFSTQFKECRYRVLMA